MTTERRWPAYLFGGRFRTSTFVLIVAFFVVWWLYAEYKPAPAPPPQKPASDVVPPGFVPDPNYTWVPRTNVETPRTTTPTTTTTTTPTTTDTTSPTETTSPTNSTSSGAPTTTSSSTTTPAPPGAPVPTPSPSPSR